MTPPLLQCCAHEQCGFGRVTCVNAPGSRLEMIICVDQACAPAMRPSPGTNSIDFGNLLSVPATSEALQTSRVARKWTQTQKAGSIRYTRTVWQVNLDASAASPAR